MPKTESNVTASGNSKRPKTKASKLGRELRRIREKIVASGEKLLTRREIEREVAERRGAR